MKSSYIFASLLLLLPPVTLLGRQQKPLKIEHFSANNTTYDTSLCAVVDRYFQSTDARAAKPYIKVVPNDPHGVSLSYDEICVTGLKPDVNYTIKIHQDIPLGHAKLDKDYSFTKTTPHYAPSIKFRDGGYILPAKGKLAIPVDTVNVRKILVRLYHINRRNLINSINDYGMVKELTEYSLHHIETQDGYLIWKKRLPIESRLNQAKKTLIPIGEYLKKRDPGVYILSAAYINRKGEVDTYNSATQWFMISDIGLFTMEDSKGLHIYIRHLSDATMYKKTRLELVSKNNELLGSTASKNGYALFPKNLLSGAKGLKVKAVYAYGANGDFTVLDLSHPAYDLSDRGVGGREVHGKIDGWIYTNRGIFRPGEKVPFDLLVRTPTGEVIPNIRLSARLIDSREVTVGTKLISTDINGHTHGSFEISSSASTGRWRLQISTGDKHPIAEITFLVENFVPPKIEFRLDNKPESITSDKPAIIEGQVRFLTGEPLPQGDITVNTILHKNTHPFEGYEGYHFGKANEKFRNIRLQEKHFKGGNEGNVTIRLKLNRKPGTSLPLSAHITISVNEPGGRPAHKTMDLFYDCKPAYIGIKPKFDNDAVDMNVKPRFGLVYMVHSHPSAAKLHYRLIKENVYWNWLSDKSDDWKYYKIYSDDHEVSKGTVETARHDTPLELDMLPWGNYRLEVHDDNNTVSSYRFSSGYDESMSRVSPDRLPVSIDRQLYHPGQSITVHIEPKFSGPIMISIANQKIIKTRKIQAQEGKSVTVSFKIKKDWGSSLYVLASAFRAQSKSMGATRAIGVAHVPVLDPEKILKCSLSHMHKIESQTVLDVKVHCKNTNSKPTYMSIAAVDEGILGLTNYKTPDPVNYFYGKKRLAIAIRDVYGSLIKAVGAHAEFEVGAGGEEAVARIHDIPVSSKSKIVALLHSNIRLNKNGDANISIDIPDYQGSLRLMGVAWNKNALGSVQGKVIVKDPISAELYLPRFMIVGDEANITLRSSFDKSLQEGEYSFEFNASGSISLEPETVDTQIKKENDDKTISKTFRLRAKNEGDGTIHMSIRHDNKNMAAHSWNIEVRTAYPPVYIRKVGLLDSNKTLDTPKREMTKWAKANDVELRFSSSPIIPADSLTKELISYPYYCAEQTTSRAFAVLDSNSSKHHVIIQSAIDKLLSMQKFGGGFGLWRSSDADGWISAYVLDFLTRARSAGYPVPRANIDRGLRWLQSHLDRWNTKSSKQETDAYALYVLARNKHILHSEILHRVNDKKSPIRSAGAWAHLAYALKYIGEDKRAKNVFDKAEKTLGKYSSDFFANYGGRLRDKATLVVLLNESGFHTKATRLFGDLALDLKDRKYLSTQEMSMLIRAQQGSDIKASMLNLSVDNKPLKRDNNFTISSKNLSSTPTIVNLGNRTVWYDLGFVASADPSKYKIKNHGFSIEKTIHTIDGQKISLDKIGQSSRLIIVLKGAIEDRSIKHPLITDLLPSGFEIENPDITGMDTTSSLKWLSTKGESLHKEYRDDRFVATIQPDNNNSFQLAYAVRAVTKGCFTLPPAKIEDMYQPRYHAFSQFREKKITIVDPSMTQSQKDSHQSINKSEVHHSVSKLSSNDYIGAYNSSLSGLDKYSLVQLNYLRNGIFALAGLDFKKTNPGLHKRFSKFSWYHPASEKSGIIYANLTSRQRQNVQSLLKEEKRRCGGLVLADFYRARIRQLDAKFLSKYTKGQLRILRNSLIARYGYRYKDPQLNSIFSQMPWYHPSDILTSEVIDHRMNSLERANVQTILQEEGKR